MSFNNLVDGFWKNWNEWSDCSVTCENGTQTRNRSCESPINDGLICDQSYHNNETRECSSAVANCPINGSWSDFGDWSDQCDSVTCGLDVEKFRMRSCSMPEPMYNGENCTGPSIEFQNCGLPVCPGGKCSLAEGTCIGEFSTYKRLLKNI